MIVTKKLKKTKIKTQVYKNRNNEIDINTMYQKSPKDVSLEQQKVKKNCNNPN